MGYLESSQELDNQEFVEKSRDHSAGRGDWAPVNTHTHTYTQLMNEKVHIVRKWSYFYLFAYEKRQFISAS